MTFMFRASGRMKDPLVMLDVMRQQGISTDGIEPHRHGWLLIRGGDGYVYCEPAPEFEPTDNPDTMNRWKQSRDTLLKRITEIRAKQ